MNARRALLLALFVLAVIAPLAAAAAYAPTIALPTLVREPTMTGQVDASWKGAARIIVGYDFTNHRPAAKPTTVYVGQDPTGLDVAFVVTQAQAVEASTLTNGPAVQNDDNVGVFIAPQGAQGFGYQFFANARGARTQSSSENTAYAPRWTAVGRIAPLGYTVTMHIPFAILRTGGSTKWRVQFERFQVATNTVDVWANNVLATSQGDPTFFGTLIGVSVGKKGGTSAKRPAPRFQPYILGVGRSSAAGGSTSQMGLDMAVPITPTASFVGSFHPDYSNVETDQQTISPTAFPRQYQEVRPFFTQVANAFNSNVGCINCPYAIYTPSIPTFRQGYGVEGTQGPITFSGFDAVGFSRTDAAGAVYFARSTPKDFIGINAQRVSVNTSSFTDSTTTLNGGYGNQHTHMFVYGNYGREDGTFITDPSQAHYGEIGAGYNSPNTILAVAHQFIGAQYSPLDGYVMQSDIGGYEAFWNQTIHFPARSRFEVVYVSASDGHFWNHLNQPARSSSQYGATVNLKNRWSLGVNAASSFVLTSQGEYLPFNTGNGATVGYNVTSNFPVSLTYGTGAYYHGHAATWQFSDTMPLRRKISLSLSLNENMYASQRIAEPSFRQWLNSVSVNWQFSRDASLALGARRINGISLPNAYFAPSFTPIFANNLSAAFHYLRGHNEFYLVYGDPNSFTTTPAVFFKWIFYAGAEKGT
ncbi:MAG: DOMON domain-containing protein [Vulcanimicrobiaceae bacterium]